MTESSLFRLDGKRALVTGAASGIGRAIAESFAARGAKVWLVDRDASAVATVADAIQEQGFEASAECTDVADESAVRELGARVGSIDVLVSNAGVGHVGDIFDTSADDLDRLHAVNVRGVFLCAKAFVPGMIERGHGSVVNMASIGGIVAVRQRLAYTTTKFAVVGFTKALCLDHSQSGVRFNCICPGRVETPFVRQRLAESRDPEAAYREMAATQLTGRMVKPDEVAAAAVYLAADVSAMVTGSCLVIDGGWSSGK